MEKIDQKWCDEVNQYANKVIELKQQNAALVEALEMIANAKGVFAHELSGMAKQALALAEANNE